MILFLTHYVHTTTTDNYI